MSEAQTLRRLKDKLQRDTYYMGKYNAYYEGMHRLDAMGLSVPPNLRQFTTVVNWPRVVVDAVEERIDVQGFRLAGAPEADDDLWRIWQANNLDEESQLAHLEALVCGRSYVVVGSNEADPSTPIVTVESPMEMITERDPRTRQITAALRLTKIPSLGGAGGPGSLAATLMLPNVTVWLSGSPMGARWIEDRRDEHGLGEVAVVPIVNRARLADRDGTSEIVDVASLTDAAARALTNAQMATEIAAIPQRWVAGMTKGDFADKNGNILPTWQTYLGAIWAAENADTKFGQFTAADLTNFTKIVDHYAHHIAALKGIPLRYFGQNTANPPSADGIRADEARLIKTCERRTQAWSGSWEHVACLIRRFADGVWDPALQQLETLWADPATPTKAQAADAAVKLHAEGILPTEAIWEELGFSAERRKKLREQVAAERADPLMTSLLGVPVNSQVGTGLVPSGVTGG